MHIYKIFRTDEWQALRDTGETAGAPVDLADGYVHFSTATQAAETAAKHFAGVDGLFLLAVDAEARLEPIMKIVGMQDGQLVLGARHSGGQAQRARAQKESVHV